MQDGQLLYLSKADVAAVGLPMAKVIELVEAGFREKGAGRVEMPPKPGIHPGQGDNFIHAMPAYIPSLNAAGIKWVSGYPENYRRGLPYIMGLIILNDPETGRPLAVMDCEWVTAMRTGAATAVAARYLARPESSVLGVLGCGVQGRTNTEALHVLFPLQRVLAYDHRPETAQAFAAEMHARFGLDVIPVRTPREAVAGCDLVVTAGPILKQPHATIQADWLKPGGFASLVDFDSYWHPQALRQAAKFCTDDVPQFEHYRALGYFQDVPPIYADLGELVAGQKPGRASADERTIACNLGLALDDLAVAPSLYAQAVARNLGQRLPL
ncbi:MAG: ornithine cyclodeaminase family protein [Anaerolineales bacterium]|nr:ornithine cyclodeaminase family protein [Anaerolineales bacterium]